MASAARVPPPPRDLNVQSMAQCRAPELQSLHAIVAARAGNQFRIPRGKRRRTTSFHNLKRRAKRRRVEDEGDERRPCRRDRRREELRDNPDCGYVTSADGTKRLRTHLWHAKRFTMVKRWGFFLPLGLHGRGRGSRALLKWLNSGAIIHDASYCSPVELKGPQDSLLAVMKCVLVPSPADLPDKKLKSIMAGAVCENALLCSAGSPSQFVAPVTYMWRPSIKDDRDNEVETCLVSNGCCMADGTGSKNECSSSTSFRQIWVWLHAAAFNEGFNVLRTACSQQTNVTSNAISCISLEGQLAKFEIMGNKAIDKLKKLLHPFQESRDPSDSLLKLLSNNSNIGAGEAKNVVPFILDNMEYIPSHTILSLEVCDPRDLRGKRMEEDAITQFQPTRSDLGSNGEDFDKHQLLVHCGSNKMKETIPLPWFATEDGCPSLSDSKDLWAFRGKIKPPRTDNDICSEKHDRRLEMFYMNEVSSRTAMQASEDVSYHTCPLLLVRHKDLKHATWWSIILPLKWAKAFWIPLASSGTHSTGQREMRWIASDNEMPSFPFDFPDCKAYSAIMNFEAVASDEFAKLRSPSARLSRVPIPSPWSCLRCSVQKENQIWDYNQISGSQSQPDLGQEESFSNYYIIRALDILQCHQKMVAVDSASRDLPQLDWISKMKSLMPGEGRLCLLRVLLQSFREGFFEEGAIVCAPTLNDCLLWTSRDMEQRKLQIPHAHDYFVERNPGKWVLQVPEDPLSRQSFRWPIGFVTTGFVHGSSRPVAVAFCEATLLAKLKCQQDAEMQDKLQSEIFVLIRNIRSTAYRLAHATVVLEKQQEDFDFL